MATIVTAVSTVGITVAGISSYVKWLLFGIATSVQLMGEMVAGLYILNCGLFPISYEAEYKIEIVEYQGYKWYKMV